MYAIKQNEKIITFNKRSDVTNAKCKAKELVIQTQGLEYASDETLEELGFKLVVDPELGENQYFSEVKYSDGIFYRTAKDIIEIVKDKEYYCNMFDIAKAKKDLFNLFKLKMLTYSDFRSQAAVIMELIAAKGFNDLNQYSAFMYQIGEFSEFEYAEFLTVFDIQNIELTTYTNF